MGSESPAKSEIKAKRTAKTSAIARVFGRRNLVVETRLWGIALLCGILVGLIMCGMRAAIVSIELLGFGVDNERITTAVSRLDPIRVVTIPVIGGILVAIMLWLGKTFGIRGDPRIGGIRDVINARQHVLDKRGRFTPLADMHMSLKDGLQTFCLAVVSLGSGASAGREGPAVQIGAVLSGFFAHRLRFTPAQIRALLGCGAAAAVASSFNAPLAGVLFAHEVILGRYRISDIGPVAVAGVSGALVTRAIFGNNAVFVDPNIVNPSLFLFLGTPIMGIIAAGLAIVMIRAWLHAPDIGRRVAGALKIQIWMLPPLAGLIMGLFALAFPQILGVGYEATASAIAGGYGAAFMLILAIAKIAATTLCIGTRFGGGVFSSSIFVGAMIGGTVGAIAAAITGDGETAQSFFTVMGMGAISGAVIGAPLSTTLIVFELTRSYEAAAAVLIAVSLATVIVQAIEGGSIFDQQARRRRGGE